MMKLFNECAQDWKWQEPLLNEDGKIESYSKPVDSVYTERWYTNGTEILIISNVRSKETGRFFVKEVWWCLKREGQEAGDEDRLRHRTNGPAQVSSHSTYESLKRNTHIRYCYNDKEHRSEGPALIEMFGHGKIEESWYIENENVDNRLSEVKRCLNDACFAVKNLNDPVLKYPASKRLGNELYPELLD